MINYKPLTLETLKELDPRVAKLFEVQVGRLAQDCIDRPLDDTARKLTLELILEPVVDPASRECEKVKMAVECKAKVPVYRSSVHDLLVTNKGLKFNSDQPQQADQHSIPFEPTENDDN